ncbi:hypothetical protein PCL_11113 [Purpureocillium lilacinum]|uniref:NAD(P)-binding domain-containing protein n=1 Tax=Purpureocillium lilacinum TaxID=33203 RepID=A0A2U3EDG0_PURLI|nr:hypothetical protein PCL_11113 [Purpureocillium lilacinum]
MAGSKVLVLGGTGPAGICLLRELLWRKHAVAAFARDPAKIPDDLMSNPLLKAIKGELSDKDALEAAVSECSVVVSLLGPNTLRYINPATFTGFYETLFETMRTHGVRRIFAMSTLSYAQPNDRFSAIRWLLVALVFFVAHFGWRTARGIGRVFEEHAAGLDWTVFRIAGIEGGSDEDSWKTGREDGEVYEGWIGQMGWSASQNRAALTRWLVDAVEDGKAQWIRKMPAVSRRAGGAKAEPS